MQQLLGGGGASGEPWINSAAADPLGGYAASDTGNVGQRSGEPRERVRYDESQRSI
jgi:hypothetical protein